MNLRCLVCFLCLAGCNGLGVDSVAAPPVVESAVTVPEAPPKVDVRAAPARLAAAPATSSTATEGRFRVVFDEPASPLYRSIASLLYRSGRLRGLVEVLNREVALPADVTIRFAEEDGPLYEPRRREIVLDYGFVVKTADMLDRVDYAEKPGDLQAFVVQVIEFVVYHEVGHALIDLFDLPVLGREEDAVDTIATLLLLMLVPDGNLVALTAADLHAIESLPREELGVADFWSEHLLGQQRFAHIVCLVYGSDPRRHAPLLRRHPALRARSEGCVDDYRAQQRTWKRLLAPHLRRPIPD